MRNGLFNGSDYHIANSPEISLRSSKNVNDKELFCTRIIRYVHEGFSKYHCVSPPSVSITLISLSSRISRFIISRTSHLLCLLIGLDSIILTTSAILHLFSSSCAIYFLDFLTLFPVTVCLICLLTTTTTVFSILSLTTSPVKILLGIFYPPLSFDT